MNKFLSKLFESTVSDSNGKQHIYAHILYFGAQFARLAEEMSVLVSIFVPHYDFVLVRVNRHKIVSLFNYKDMPPTWLRFSLVYKFKCARCASQYVG